MKNESCVFASFLKAIYHGPYKLICPAPKNLFACQTPGHHNIKIILSFRFRQNILGTRHFVTGQWLCHPRVENCWIFVTVSTVGN